MTLTELRYIIAVAREGHFGRAAKACFVSQPTLSLGIKKLEDELGVTLFERGQREVVVTTIGRRIIDQAEKALREINLVKDMAARAVLDPLSQPLRIGAIHTVGPYLFPSLLPALNECAPSLRLLVEENVTAEITPRLLNGDIDAAIVSLPYDEPGIETLALYEEPFVVVLPSSHPLALQDDIRLPQLADETVLLLGPQHCLRDHILALCRHCAKALAGNDDLQNTLAGSSIETIRYMVASGVGVTILPSTAACADRYKHGLLAIRRIAGVHAGRTIALAWRRHFPRPEAITAIATAVRRCSLSGVQLQQDAPVAAKPAHHFDEHAVH